jgi:AraC family transcriptional regulator
MMLQIRNMESNCCIRVVKDELDKLGLSYKSVELGRVEIKDSIAEEKLQQIDIALKNVGFEIIIDSKSLLVEKIKSVIHQLVYLTDEQPRENFSDYISTRVNKDYTYLSNLFSSIEGITVEKYIIDKKIERIKDLMVYEQLSLNEIAYKLKYSSVAHLSNQFKKVTGLTPSSYRGLMFAQQQKEA